MIKTFSILTLTLSMIFFAMGLLFPIMSTKTRILGINLNYSSITLFDSVTIFYKAKEYFLATVIMAFTFLLPVIEYIYLIIRMLNKGTSKILLYLDKLNMLEVFLVALLVLNFKMNSNFIVMQVRIGTTFIAIAVILRILTIILVTYNKSNKV